MAHRNRRIQIQTEAIGRRAKHREYPDPERTPERLDPSLAEAGREVANRVNAGETAYPQHRVQRLIGA